MARGRNVINQAIALEGGDEIVAQLRKMGTEGEAAARKLEAAFGNVRIGRTFADNLATLKARFGELQAAGSRVAGSFASVRQSFSDVSTAAATVRNRLLLVGGAATGITVAFGAIVKSSLDAAGELADLSESLNISAEDLQAFRVIAADTGLNFADLTKGVVQVNGVLDELRLAAKNAGGSLFGAGFDVKDLSDKGERLRDIFRRMGRDIGSVTSEMDALQILGDYFRTTASEGEKLGLAIDIFGPKLGPRLVRFLNQGGDAIRRLKDEMRDMGILLGEQEVRISDAAGDAITKLLVVFEQYRMKFAALLAPAILKVTDAITTALKQNGAAISAFISGAAARLSSLLVDIVTLLSGGDESQVQNRWLVTARDAFIAVRDAAYDFFHNILLPALETVRGYADNTANLINSIFGTNFTGDGLLIAGVVTQLVGGFTLLFSALGLVVNVGSLLVSSLGVILPLFKTFAALWPVLTSGAAAFTGVLPGLIAFLGPAGLIALGLAALGAVFYVFWDEIVAGAREAFRFLQQAFSAAWDGIKAITAAAFEGVKVAFGDAWSAITAGAGAALSGIGTMFSDTWNGITNTVALARDGIVQMASDTWAGITGTVAMARDGLFAAASQTWSAISEAASAVAQAVAPVWQSIVDGASAAFSGVASLVVQAWSGASQAVVESAQVIRQAIQRATEIAGDVAGAAAIAAQLVQPFLEAQRRIAEIVSTLGDLASQGMAGVASAVDAAGAAIRNDIAAIISALRRAVAEAQRLRAAARGSGGSGYAMGGFVSGPGSATSDSIPAWLSNGEFVVRAAAVRRYGVDFLRAINGLRAGELFKGGFPAFAMGGPVGIPVPALAAAASSASGRPVMLTLGSETFMMTADDDVAEKLIRYASRRRVKSAGRKPSWYGA